MLSDIQIQSFIAQGFVRIDDAFPRELAEDARAIMWREMNMKDDDPATWTQPVVRLPGYAHGPFPACMTSPVLHDAFDQLVGVGRWKPRPHSGMVVVRFPHTQAPGDDGWHIDVSFAADDTAPHERADFSQWRANVTSRDRGLLMLILFSDVGPDDAPTRIASGSHIEIARHLAPYGAEGRTHMELAGPANAAARVAGPPVLATGNAGTVYLCHPHVVHAAQAHRGTTPRFLAQPGLPLAEPFKIQRVHGASSPVEIAIRNAIN